MIACAMNLLADLGNGLHANTVPPTPPKLDDLVGLCAKARHKDLERNNRKRTCRLAVRIRNLFDDLLHRIVRNLVQIPT